jgi:hypothetical protein
MSAERSFLRAGQAPLNRLVHSDLSITEAAERLRPIIAAEPEAAQKTLRWLRRTSYDHGYILYRGSQILHTAMRQPVKQPPPAKLDLFERERTLGSMPLAQAFDQLVEQVPALKEFAEETLQLITAIDSDSVEARWRLGRRVSSVVGDEASDPDPLVRSNLAGMIVARYLRALEGDERVKLDQPILGRPFRHGAALRAGDLDRDIRRASSRTPPGRQSSPGATHS